MRRIPAEQSTARYCLLRAHNPGTNRGTFMIGIPQGKDEFPFAPAGSPVTFFFPLGSALASLPIVSGFLASLKGRRWPDIHVSLRAPRTGAFAQD